MDGGIEKHFPGLLLSFPLLQLNTYLCIGFYSEI